MKITSLIEKKKKEKREKREEREEERRFGDLAAMAVRVLIAGDVGGNFEALNTKVTQVVTKSGDFDLLLCAGNFFSSPSSSENKINKKKSNGEGVQVDHEGGDGTSVVKSLERFLSNGGKARVPTYFIGSSVDESNVTDLLLRYPESNLNYLGRHGVLKLKELTVAYYDDVAVAKLADQSERERLFHSMCQKGAEIEGEVDILLTNSWPHGVVPSTADPKLVGVAGCYRTQNLAVLLRPRYHISASAGQFYARPPYSNPDLGAGSHATRFIGLGKVGNDAGVKYLHALGLKPASTMAREAFLSKPSNVTPFPYDNGEKKKMREAGLAASQGHQRKRELEEAGGQDWSRWGGGHLDKRPRSQFDKGSVVIDSRKSVFVRNLPYRATEEDIIKFFAPCSGTIVDIRRGKDQRGNVKGYAQIQFESQEQMEKSCSLNENELMGRKIYIDQAASKQQRTQQQREQHPIADCWFCLSNPNADLHLVASVGKESYCALDKGPITPYHMLVVPIDHASSTMELQDTTFAEMKAYVGSLCRCFSSQGLELVMFERYLKLKGREGGNHCHYNVVGIPKEAAEQLASDFKSGSANFLKLKDDFLGKSDFRGGLRELVGDGEYLLLVLPSGETLAKPIMRGERMPFNFMRDTVARCMGCPERGDWKMCRKASKEQEEQSVAKFKATFVDYDLM